MSSIREALKRAERERMSRGDRSPQPSPPPAESDAAPTAPAAPMPTPSAQSAVPKPRPEEDPEPATRSQAEDRERLQVISPDAAPILDVPVGFSEELSAFRHGVESALPKPQRALLMTSATSGEGVTTLTNYLATSLAVRDGKKTCLVDANFRSPKTSRIYGLLGRPGYSNYATGTHELNDVLSATESPDLFVVGLGTEIYNPSLVLSHERARGLVHELLQRFDYVLFDAGALMNHAETGMLAANVDGVVLIVRANRTKREVLTKAEKLVRFGGGRVIGTVLNRRSFPIPEAIYKRL